MSSQLQKYGVALFSGFQALDVFGPVDLLNFLSKSHTLQISLIAPTLDPVSTRPPSQPHRTGQSVVPTHTYETAPDDLEVLLVPGGLGTFEVEDTQVVVDFIKSRYPKLQYLLTVCTGSALAARAGVLDGKKATSNKLLFKSVALEGIGVQWQREARWVVDGNIWTSSGVTAGTDQMFAFIQEQYGDDVAEHIENISEYVRHKDPTNDPFSRLAK